MHGTPLSCIYARVEGQIEVKHTHRLLRCMSSYVCMGKGRVLQVRIYVYHLGLLALFFFPRVQLKGTQPTHSTFTPYAHTCVRVRIYAKKRLGDFLSSSARETHSTNEHARIRVPCKF